LKRRSAFNVGRPIKPARAKASKREEKKYEEKKVRGGGGIGPGKSLGGRREQVWPLNAEKEGSERTSDYIPGRCES